MTQSKMDKYGIFPMKLSRKRKAELATLLSRAFQIDFTHQMVDEIYQSIMGFAEVMTGRFGEGMEDLLVLYGARFAACQNFVDRLVDDARISTSVARLLHAMASTSATTISNRNAVGTRRPSIWG